jgi:hypothetical protein
MDLRRYIPESQDSIILAVLLILGGVVGIKDIVGLVLPDAYALYFILFVLTIIFARHIHRQVQVSSIPRLPERPKLFNPFKISDPHERFVPWPREKEVLSLAKLVLEAQHTHVILSGPSGAGKSTLVNDLLIPRLSGKYDVYPYRSYESLTLRLLSDLTRDNIALSGRLHAIETEYRTFMSNHNCHPRQIFDPSFHDNEAEALWKRIEVILNDILVGTNVKLFIFDQAERFIYLLRLENLSGKAFINGFEVLYFINFLRLVRKNNKIRTLFVVRAENLYNAFEFFSSFSCNDQQMSSGSLRHFLCPGINAVSSPDALFKIRQLFEQIPGASGYRFEFEQINGLASRALSNTFITQLCGYIVEHFYVADPNIETMLKERKDRSLVLRYYFNYLLSGYARLNPSQDAKDFVKTMLFTIAIENHLTGQPISPERVSALTHFPMGEVEPVVAFLSSVGVLTKETFGATVAYRLAHDIVSDYVMKDEQFGISASLKDGIRGLAEARVDTAKLKKSTPESFPNLLLDPIFRPNIGAFAILFFALQGLALTRSTSFCEMSRSWLFNWFPLVETCDVTAKIYVGTFVAYMAWLTFIYNMHRGYFRYVLRGKWLRGVSATMPVVGAILATMFSHSAVLSILPIAIVGSIMGIVLICGVLNGSFIGRMATPSLRWGVRTVANMLFAAALSGVSAVGFWSDPVAVDFRAKVAEVANSVLGAVHNFSGDQISVIWMYLLDAVLVYFWWHIKPEQQSKMALSSNLAMNDRTHAEEFT